MKKITLLLLLYTICASAQKEANNWFFGQFAGIHFLEDGTVEALNGSAMTTNEGCSTISDSNGNLLFYTDGRSVWDRNHVIMPNGNYLGGTGLFGDPSSTQSGIIVPSEDDPDIYFIFTVDEPHQTNAAVYPEAYTGDYEEPNGFIGTIPDADDGLNNGLNYSIVDLSIIGENGSIGDVTTRNVHLLTYDPDNDDEAKYKCSEKITAVENADHTGFWVIAHFIDKFYAFEVTGNSVNETPVITQIAPVVTTAGYRRNAIGCIKASPNGKMLAIAHVQRSNETGGSSDNGVVYLYDFDDATGVLSNPVQVKNNAPAYGVEFSPKSEKLYVSYDNQPNGFGGIHQYDLLSNDIAGSDQFIASTTQSGTLQLGPNGKIYRAVVQGTILNVINNPDEPGALCNFQANGVFLTGTCAFGLPPFITSFFSAAILIDGTCEGQATHFELDVTDDFDGVEWDFGDGSPTTTEIGPSHTYAVTGIYEVTATIDRDGEISTISTNVTIHATPIANDAPSLTACDPENDHTANFTLANNTVVILGAQDPAQFTVEYFASLENAEAGQQPLNEENHTNTEPLQTIWARVTNTDNTACFDITSFRLEPLQSPMVPATDEAMVCLNTREYTTLHAIDGTTANFTFLWSTGATTPTIQVNEPGTYSVTVTNSLGCGNSKVITVHPSDVAVIDEIIINDLRDNNTVTVIASPPPGIETTYLYSLDRPNGPFSESNVFENVQPGLHTVYITEVNGCGTVAEEISILGIPKFFTPNGDGVNDTWNIIGVNSFFYPASKIFIFDRYGKLLADVDPRGPGWDGDHQGYKLPATDYWYVVRLDNGRVAKGHFSLMR